MTLSNTQLFHFSVMLRVYVLVTREMHIVVTKWQCHASHSNTVQRNMKQLTWLFLMFFFFFQEPTTISQNPPNSISFKSHWLNRVKWPLTNYWQRDKEDCIWWIITHTPWLAIGSVLLSHVRLEERTQVNKIGIVQGAGTLTGRPRSTNHYAGWRTWGLSSSTLSLCCMKKHSMSCCIC